MGQPPWSLTIRPYLSSTTVMSVSALCKVIRSRP
jgi:hypothetical protein